MAQRTRVDWPLWPIVVGCLTLAVGCGTGGQTGTESGKPLCKDPTIVPTPETDAAFSRYAGTWIGDWQTHSGSFDEHIYFGDATVLPGAATITLSRAAGKTTVWQDWKEGGCVSEFNAPFEVSLTVQPPDAPEAPTTGKPADDILDDRFAPPASTSVRAARLSSDERFFDVQRYDHEHDQSLRVVGQDGELLFATVCYIEYTYKYDEAEGCGVGFVSHLQRQ